jgi:hypothetical protein
VGISFTITQDKFAAEILFTTALVHYTAVKILHLILQNQYAATIFFAIFKIRLIDAVDTNHIAHFTPIVVMV